MYNNTTKFALSLQLDFSEKTLQRDEQFRIRHYAGVV